MAVIPVCTPSPGQGEHGYVTIVDIQGYPIGSVASSDGAPFGSISGESQFLYTSGGPPLLDGTPSGLSFDRARGYLGKGAASGAITPSAVGDAALGFAVAPRTIMPGSAIRLSGSGTDEYVYVANFPAYTPSPTVTSIPLESPVVHAGQSMAYWEIFNPNGAGNSYFSPAGVGLSVLAMPSFFQNQLVSAVAAYNDGTSPESILEIVPGKLTSTLEVERERMPHVFRPFNAQAVSAAASNTPTPIWTPASSKKFRLMGYWFSTTNAAGLLFHDLVATGGTGLLNIPSPIHEAGAVIQSPPLGNGILSVVANNTLFIDATAATTLTGFVFGTEE